MTLARFVKGSVMKYYEAMPSDIRVNGLNISTDRYDIDTL